MSPPITGEERTAGAQVDEGGPTPDEGVVSPDVVPVSGAREVRVLYLFAGARRRSGLARSLRLACKGTGTRVVVDEIDILRGGRAHDLLNKTRQKKLLSKVQGGRYHLTAASPPCGSFSRSRSANNRGPKPVRSREFPRGSPWLQGEALKQTKLANDLVDFTTRVLSAQMTNSPGLTILEHPEDLGKTGQDVPGSIWQLENVRALGDSENVDTGAIRQSDFGTIYQKPTRLLGRLPGLANHVFGGWPCFCTEGYYTGPLPKFTGTSARLIGRKGKAFKTTDTAAWPDKLCHLLAQLTVAAVCHPAQAEALAKGVLCEVANDRVAAPARLPQSDSGTLAIPEVDLEARGPPKRRKITQAELDTLASGHSLKDNEIYVGRGGRGVPPSRWGNPFKIGPHVTRSEAISRFMVHFKEQELFKDIGELVGKDLLCHCGPLEACHADYLMAVAGHCVQQAAVPHTENLVDDGLPVRIRRPTAPVLPLLEPAVSAGWGGRGPSRRARHIGGDKPFCDGGGLCSPGRWAPEKRLLPSCLGGLNLEMHARFAEAVQKASGGKDDSLGFMLKLATGRFKSCPFDEALLGSTREAIRRSVGMSASDDVVASNQVFHLNLISRLLKVYGDPDWAFVDSLGEGVPLGVDEPLPRTPAVFEEKSKWKLPDDAGPGCDVDENYQSVGPHLERVKALFREEAALGWMEEYPVDVAREKFGSRLAIAALGVVAEKDKIRVVHDGSHTVHVNHRIKVRDQIRCPGAGDVRAILQERVSAGARSFGVLGDVSKAHRRIKIAERDWGYQACQLEDSTIWVNKVGTYGMTSASYWWARLAAALLVRLCHYVAGNRVPIDILLYVDDHIMLTSSKAGIVLSGMLIYFLVALGVPWRWDKCRGGTEVDWIGYWADLWHGRLGISVRRAEWLAGWMGRQASEGSTDMADFTAVLGRLCFAMGPLEFLRPFVAPLFAWAAAVGPRGKIPLPWSVTFVLRLLESEFLGPGRVAEVRVVSRDLGIAFRADAKAEDQSVRIGGWECLGGTRPGAARWFSADLTKANAPWAFSRGEPYRTIASLELFATLVCIVSFGDAWPSGATGEIRLQGITDNQGNSFAVKKLMSSKFPLVVILAEVAAQLRQRSMALSLGWAPRDQNEEADALTNGDFSQFSPSNRVNVVVGEVKWLILPKMLQIASDIYEDVTRRKASREQPPLPAPASKKAKGCLRQRDPW